MGQKKSKIQILDMKKKFTGLIVLPTKIPRFFFAREALISGEGRLKNLGEMAKNSEIYCYINQGMMNFNKEYLTSFYSLVDKSSHCFGSATLLLQTVVQMLHHISCL